MEKPSKIEIQGEMALDFVQKELYEDALELINEMEKTLQAFQAAILKSGKSGINANHVVKLATTMSKLDAWKRERGLKAGN